MASPRAPARPAADLGVWAAVLSPARNAVFAACLILSAGAAPAEGVGSAGPAGSHAGSAHAERVSVHLLPDPLREVWRRTRPEMNDASRCAAAFDAGDPDRMILQCSVYIRLAAEGERRALRYCEAKREELHIKGPCRIVTE